MHDILIIILIILFVALAIGAWVILNRFIALGYYIADIWKAKQPSPHVHTHGIQIESDKPKPKSKLEVEQLPLDVLAPKLKDPPRSPGGFGSKVSEDT